MINVFQPSFDYSDLSAVSEVLDSRWVGKGKLTGEFEAAFAKHIGVLRPNVISVLNCTQGLFISMKLLGIKEGDEVILPSISFVGAANAVVAAGAKPVFCDVDRHRLNPTLSDIAGLVTDKTKAILILHYGGVPSRDLDCIAEHARENGIYLIEDAACSVSSTFDNRACGTFGDIGVWSFDPMKILCCIEGGMLYISDVSLIEKARRLMFLGVSSESGITSTSFRWWEFDVDYATGRYTTNDVFSAIGLSQLDKLAGFIVHRRAVWDLYQEILGDRRKFGWLDTPPEPHAGTQSSYYMYWIQTERRDTLAHFLREHGIYTTFRYYPLHLIPFYNSTAELNNSIYAAERTLCLPIHQEMTSDDVEQVCAAIRLYGREHLL